MGRIAFKDSESRFNFWRTWDKVITFIIDYILKPISIILGWVVAYIIIMITTIWGILAFFALMLKKLILWIWSYITLKHLINFFLLIFVISIIFFTTYNYNLTINYYNNYGHMLNIYEDSIILFKRWLIDWVKYLYLCFYDLTPFSYGKKRVIWIGNFFVTRVDMILFFMYAFRYPLKYYILDFFNISQFYAILQFIICILIMVMFILFLFNLIQDYVISKNIRYFYLCTLIFLLLNSLILIRFKFLLFI